MGEEVISPSSSMFMWELELNRMSHFHFPLLNGADLEAKSCLVK